MGDRDIRNFFSSDGSKSSTNKSNLVKQIVLNPQKDIKKITKKAEKKPKKEKVKITKEEKIEEKKEFNTPIKKKELEIAQNNIKQNKPKKSEKRTKSKNKKIILDEDEESEISEIKNNNKKEAGKKIKISKNETKKEDEDMIKEEVNNYIPPPVKKEEKLIPISVSDFFNTKKITLKTEVREVKMQQEKVQQDINNNNQENNKEKNNNMEIEEEEDKHEKEKIQEIKLKEKIEEKNNDINIDNYKFKNTEDNNIMDDIFDDIEMENENKDKKAEVPKKESIKEFNIKINPKELNQNKNKDINLNNNTKNQSLKKENNNPRPIIHRVIKREIKNTNETKKAPIPKTKMENNKNIQYQIPISELWIDKYAPKVINDIIGNQQQIRNLINWLDNWDNNILYGNKKENPSKVTKKFNKFENVNARAAIISGPPGIGKTSAVRVIAKTKGYRTFELNSSDKRNKDSINNSVGFLMNNTTLSSVDNSTTNKNMIIMDEIDGMAGNEDKGGIKALIDIAKKTKVPIIFICNDIYSPKIKSLLTYCYDIRFYKPDKRQIVFKLIDICKKEDIRIDNQTLNYIVESFGLDIRQIYNYLDLSSRNKRNIGNIKNNSEQMKKDKSVTVGSFDICKILLNRSESSKLNFDQKLDLYFVDFDLIPNMIHENYLSTTSISNFSKNNTESLSKIIQGLDHMSMGDTIENKMKSQMEWSLLPDKGIHSTVIPSMIFSSYLEFANFPQSIGKISRLIKVNKEIKELKKIFSDYSIFEISNIVGPLFFNIITNKLIDKGKEEIDNIVDLLVHFGMNVTMFKENLFDIQSKNNQNLYNKINTSVKTTLTKKLNEKFKTSLKHNKTRTIMMPKIKVDKDGNLLDDEDDDDIEEEEADDQSSSIFEPIKKVNKKKKNK